MWYSTRKILHLQKPHISVYFEARAFLFGLECYPHFVNVHLGVFGIVLAWRVLYKYVERQGETAT